MRLFNLLSSFARTAHRFKNMHIFTKICYSSALCSIVYVSFKHNNQPLQFKHAKNNILIAHTKNTFPFKYSEIGFAKDDISKTLQYINRVVFGSSFTALCQRNVVDSYLDEIADDRIDEHFHLQHSITSIKKQVSANKMLDIFKHMYYSGQEISKDFLREMFLSAGIQDRRIADHLFDLMDRNRDGILQPTEIMAVLTMFQAGNNTQRFKFLFRCLDLDGGGTVDKNEFRLTLTAILEARYHLGGLNDLYDHDEIFSNVYPHEYHTVAKFKSNRIVRDIFLVADTNRDGELSLKEFLHWCRTGSKEVRLLEQALITAVGNAV